MNNQEVLELMKENKEFRENLFCYSGTTSNNQANNFAAIVEAEFQGVKWLYLTTLNRPSIIGLKDERVYSILDGELYQVCESLSELPYELLKIRAESETDGGTVEELLREDTELKNLWLKYKEEI